MHRTFILSLLLSSYPLIAEEDCQKKEPSCLTSSQEEKDKEDQETEKKEDTEDKEEDKDDEEKEDEEKAPPPRRALPSPFDGIFPTTEFPGPTIGVPNTDPIYPLTKSIFDQNPCLKKLDIRFYGWFNPSVNLSTSRRSNFPMGFQIVPNSFQLNQAVFRIDRQPDTVQTLHHDWGFRLTNLYGIDYRLTIAQGFFSQQLAQRNNLYGYDLLEAYLQFYTPWIGQGMVVTIGRYLSPADIESPLAPQNFLITHSIMNTYDCYTQTGITFAIKFDLYWSCLVGLHTGCDVMPWAKGVHFPSLIAMLRWVSYDNTDSLWGGIDAYNGGRYKAFWENMQEFTLTWSHRFSDQFFMMTEIYYTFQRDALLGGSCIFGPPRSFYENVGCGPLIKGISSALGIVNFLELKICDKEYVSLRTDYLNDFKGNRTGYPTQYYSISLGLNHVLNDVFIARAEGRYELSSNKKPYDNGRWKYQAMVLADIISKF